MKNNITEQDAKDVIDCYNETYGTSMPYSYFNMREAKLLLYESKRVLNIDKNDILQTIKDFAEVRELSGEEKLFNMKDIRLAMGHFRFELKLYRGEF